MVAGSGLGFPVVALPSLLLWAMPPAAAPWRSGEQVAATVVLTLLLSAHIPLLQGHLLGDGLSGLCPEACPCPCLGVTCTSHAPHS